MIKEFIKRNSKKLIITSLVAATVVASVGGYIYTKQNEFKNKVVRFHVLANSDSNVDQAVKLKVKDEVIKYVQPLLKESKSIEQSKDILNSNKDKIIAIANKELSDNGQTYTASAKLSKFDFPVKSYGDIVFPSGEYEAFRIVLGNGEGKNWWCVMFPPLCFIDVKNAVADKEMQSELSKVLTDEELEKVNAKKENTNVKFKFKAVEVLKGLMN
ncbi:MAG: stage II sporulation protein R [Clostridium sp.]|uniref:stage II sporulation protein R n=1 Tax=Clostridium sp. TaxID=1506 RepID=UPI002FCB658F